MRSGPPIGHCPAIQTMKQNAKSKSSKPPQNGIPGQVLKSLFMDPLGLTAYRVAKDIGITAIAMSHILRGQRSITPSVALRLGQYFGVEAEFWLSLQTHHDLAKESTGSKKKLPTMRCAALEGRAFVLKETKINGVRNWQVLMARTSKR